MRVALRTVNATLGGLSAPIHFRSSKMPSPTRAFCQLQARRSCRCLLVAGVLSLLGIDPPPALAQQVEIQIRSAAPNDDYLTWAPAPARIRQTAAAADKRVVLTNDPERPAP